MTIIKINDRYPCPGPRYRSIGSSSGEDFRITWLSKELKRSTDLTIDLDGTAGYGSSFLEEAFGGLIRVDNVSPNDVLKIKYISNEEPELIDEIKGYINEAIEELNA